MFTRRLVLVCLALATTLVCAPGVVIRDDTSDSLYRRLGKKAAFSPVGRVEIDYGRGYEAIATATLYGVDRIVSAGHVFDSSSLDGAVGVRINFGRGRVAYIDFLAPGVVNVHPGYDPVTLADDVSVVFLPPTFQVRTAALYQGGRVRKNTTITFVGFGDTGTGKTGSKTYSITKRGGQNTLGNYYLGGRDFEVDFDRPGHPEYSSLGGKNPIRLESLIGPGDSGGSVWVRIGGRWQIIGINSFGEDWFPRGNGNRIQDDYGDRSGFVYLPRYYAWMNSLVSPY
ncbi:MAG: trypsin-like serine peptidase [Chthoniobacterales bacterium]